MGGGNKRTNVEGPKNQHNATQRSAAQHVDSLSSPSPLLSLSSSPRSASVLFFPAFSGVQKKTTGRTRRKRKKTEELELELEMKM